MCKVKSELTFLLLLHFEVNGLYAVHDVPMGQQGVVALPNIPRCQPQSGENTKASRKQYKLTERDSLI